MYENIQIRRRKCVSSAAAPEIRQEIATAKENISLPVVEIAKRVHETLDWRGYLKGLPYWELGAAAGLGYLGSRLFVKRTTPMERIMRPIAEGFRSSVDGLRTGAVGSGLIKLTLIGMATKAAGRWIKNAIS